MKEDLLNIYNNFDSKKLDELFDDLVKYVNNYEYVFSRYTVLDYLEEMKKFDSKYFVIGHSDDNFLLGIPYYKKNILDGIDEQEITNQVTSLIWDLGTYMTDEICPNCHESNLRLTTTITKKNELVKFCDECLYKGISNKYVDIQEELIPATKTLITHSIDESIEGL
ncbi:hypothetical protein ACYSNR_07065 [Enterococcus sp. LJL128]